ncbi:MAG: RAMP superfamily CRISPR-associated protein [Promethearchaeota archaeon]
MQLIIKTESYSLIGSSEKAGIIDNDIVYDKYGIPYIPSRRIKGLLRASAFEICDILGLKTDYIDFIFGRIGFQKSKIRIGNMYIPNYNELKKDLKLVKLVENNEILRNIITKMAVINYFSKLRYQTAIENGVSKDLSLRTLRVLKPDLRFEGEISELQPLTIQEKAFLYLTVLNLKRIGTLRNRGFGRIKCEIKNIGINSIDKALDYINRKSVDNEKINKNIKTFNYKKSNSHDKFKMEYYIRTISPIIISKQIGEQNIVYTENYISSQTVRGILANKFIELCKLEEPHKNDAFYDLFLDGKLMFNAAYPQDFKNNIYHPPALFIQKEKNDNEIDNITLYNVFESEINKSIIPINNYIFLSNSNVYIYLPQKDFSFHITKRKNLYGAEIEEIKSIFYYEYIEQDEVFKGELISNKEILSELKNIFGEKFNAYIGKSKTAQYGLVEFKLGDIKEINYETNYETNPSEFIIWSISPIILYNDDGNPEVSTDIFKKYLEEKLKCNIQIKNCFIKTGFIESYINVWRLKTRRLIAYMPGSSFHILIEDQNCNFNIKSLEYEGIGENTENGYGRIKILENTFDKYKIKTIKEEIDNYSYNNIDLFYNILISKLKECYEYQGYRKAIDFENNKNKISNNLIGRLENILINSKTLNEWKDQLEMLKDKQAALILMEVNLWDKLLKFYLYDDWPDKIEYIEFSKLPSQIWDKINEDNNEVKFELSKTYWLSFFRYLRIFKRGS